MHLYEVKWEEDGRTVKAPGVSETEIKACSAYFLAESAEAVWEACAYIRTDPERNFRLLAKVLDSVTIVPAVGKEAPHE